MASYRGHLSFATVLGSAYGSVAAWHFGLDWGPVFLGAGLTAVGGLLPDLDSDTGVPIRKLSGLAAMTVPLLIFGRLRDAGFTMDQTLVILIGVAVFVRFALSEVFKRFTVHRGMFHSIPAMFIAGLAVFHVYHHPDLAVRLYLAGGVVLGFFSHLLLDEVCSVGFNGVKLHLKQSAGSAFKFFSSSWTATAATYAVLGGLIYLTHQEMQGTNPTARRLPEPLLRIMPW